MAWTLPVRITRQDLWGAAITLVALVAVAWMQRDSLKQLQAQADQVLTPAEYQRQSEQTAAQLELLKRIPSFGFENLIGDWAFLQFLQYFGDWRARETTGYELSPNFFQVSIPRDPRFVKTYVFLSTSTSLYAGQPQLTIKLMDQGLASLSPEKFDEAYLVWVYRGIDELLFLGDAKAAQRSFEMAADWVSVQGTPEAEESAAYYRKTANFLKGNRDLKQAQINSWMMVLAYSVTGRGQQLAIENLRKLGVNVKISPDGRVTVDQPNSPQ